MRVIAGTARGRRLQSVPGDSTRPITDRAKEALFSILHPDLPEARILDLFAGTGAIGLEALSRGAAWCDFNELAPKARETIKKNLATTGLAPRAAILGRDAFALVAGPAPAEPYDYIFVAPPQYQGQWKRALELLDAAIVGGRDWLTETGEVVVQIHPKEWEAPALGALEEIDRRKYGSVLLVFFGHAEGQEGAP